MSLLLAGCVADPEKGQGSSPTAYAETFELDGYLLEKAVPCVTTELCVNPGLGGDMDRLEIVPSQPIKKLDVELTWTASSLATATLSYRLCKVDGERCEILQRGSGESPIRDSFDLDADHETTLLVIIHTRDDETTGTLDLRQEFHLVVRIAAAT